MGAGAGLGAAITGAGAGACGGMRLLEQPTKSTAINSSAQPDAIFLVAFDAYCMPANDCFCFKLAFVAVLVLMQGTVNLLGQVFGNAIYGGQIFHACRGHAPDAPKALE